MDIFNENKNAGEGAPSMFMGDGSGSPDFSQYKYRVERFTLGSFEEDDEATGLEALLTRSIGKERDVVIIERKDSISATTGIYTCVIIYLERRHTEGAQNA